MKHLTSLGHTSTVPQLRRGRTASAGLRSPAPGLRSRAAPVCGPLAIPLRRARLASGWLRRRLSGGRRHDAVLLHHSDPARGVPSRHDLLVVGSWIRVGHAVLQDRMDHADQLVGGGEDGLLVVLPRPERAEVAVELAVLGPGSGMRALDEDPPERRVALPGASAPPPSAALVVARAEPGPCGAVRVRGEDADVRSEFDQDGARRRGPDPGDGLQQAQRLRVLAVLGEFAVEDALAVRDRAVRPVVLVEKILVDTEVKFPKSAEVKFPSLYFLGGGPVQSPRVSFFGRPRFFGGGGGMMGAFARTCSGMRSACARKR